MLDRERRSKRTRAYRSLRRRLFFHDKMQRALGTHYASPLLGRPETSVNLYFIHSDQISRPGMGLLGLYVILTKNCNIYTVNSYYLME